MYTKFYGLSEKPFELLPDPRFLFLTTRHQKMIASVMDGIRNRRGFISVTGEVGSGKTTFVRYLLDKFEREEKVKTVLIFHPTITFKELLKNIFLELDLEVMKDSRGALLHQFNEYLIQMDLRGETLLMIIDEAQDLSEEVMGELGMLPKSASLRIIFVGQPEFEDKLNSQGLKQLRQRVPVKHQIRAFSEEESRNYINHRLRLVGSSSSERFTPKAISMICSHAKGIPRLINLICDKALYVGYSLFQKKTDVDTIREVTRDMKGPFLPKTLLHPRLNFFLSGWFLIVLAIICLGGFVFLIDPYFQPRPAKTSDIKSLGNPHVDTQPSPTLPFPQESEISKHELDKHESDKRELKDHSEVVTVEKGQTLSFLAQKYYHTGNTTLVTFILDFNPEITNANFIMVDQKIKIPKMTEELLIMLSTDHTYRIHLGTFRNPKSVMFYRNESSLGERTIEIFPRKVSPQDTWYQVVAGPFDRKDECLEVIDQFKGKGLLPAFGGILKME
ncbi:MAG TPA: AAA family ATPase [Thermodesulfobacteriota bacterium]|nr:AAA family ATPase [Thermodesulfobacteriota bacterium]